MSGHAEAGAKAQYGPRVLGNVGLEKCDLHSVKGLDDGALRQALPAGRVAMKCLDNRRSLRI
jgi:hypothetical protein